MKITPLPNLIILILVFSTTACSKENWYQGAQSAQAAQCMKQPFSEYDDCNQQSNENYETYIKNRDDLLLE